MSEKKTSHRRRSSSVSRVALFSNSALDTPQDDAQTQLVQDEADVINDSTHIGDIPSEIRKDHPAQPLIITGDPDEAKDPEMVKDAVDREYPLDKDETCDSLLQPIQALVIDLIPPDTAVEDCDKAHFAKLFQWLDRCKQLGRRAVDEFAQNAPRFFRRFAWRRTDSDGNLNSVCAYYFGRYFVQVEFSTGALVGYTVLKSE